MMDNKQRRFEKATLVLGAAMVTVLCLPCSARAQTSAPQDQQTIQNQDRQAVQNDQDRQAVQNDQDRGGNGLNDQDRGNNGERRQVANFDQFLDSHREIAEQVRKDPSLLDNRNFVQSHPALETFLQENPGVRNQLRQDPNAFMRQENAYDRESNLRDREAGGQDRGIDRRDAENFGRFMDQHREIAEQVRKDPSLLDNRAFVENHPALQAYLRDNSGVRDQLRQDPNAFVRQQDTFNRDANSRDRDPVHDHMAQFGGFLNNHSDIQKDVSRNPSVVKDHDYVQNHAELNAYLNAHPDVRADLMANPHSFVQGAQQYHSGSGSSSGAGVTNGRGTGSTATGTTGSATGTSANPTMTHEPSPTTTPHDPSKPNH